MAEPPSRPSSADAAPVRTDRSVLALHALALAVVGGTLFLAGSNRPLYRQFLQEDGWAEWATFLLFVTAGGLGIRGFVRTEGRFERLAFVGLSAFCLFVAGEEISWGQRLLAFQPPEVFLEENYQQESNLHNLLKNVLDTRWMVLAVAAGYGVMAPLLARHVPRWPAAWAPAPMLSPWFAAVVLLEAFYPYTLTGELAELTLGLCFSADLALRTQKQAPRRATLVALVLPLALAGLFPPAVDAWTAAHAAETTAEARSELERLADDLRHRRIVQHSLRGKRRVHKRIFTAVQAGYLRFGTRSTFLGQLPTPAETDDRQARRDARGYFLDPWQQPYWVRYERVSPDHGRILLYSFGANRRRDSNTKRLAKVGEDRVLGGDDVGVTLDVYWQ